MSGAASCFEALGVPPSLMQDVAGPGSEVGRLDRKVCEETGVPASAASWRPPATTPLPPSRRFRLKAMTGCSSVPERGLWSASRYRGRTEAKRCRRYNFTNEGGVGGTFRLLKNVTGFWLLQRVVPLVAVRLRRTGLTLAAAAASPLTQHR